MKPDDLYTLLQRRATCRDYLPDPIPEAVLGRVLEAGLSAPAGSNFQHFSIVKVTDPGARAQLAKCSRDQSFIARAPVSLVFCFDYSRAMQVRRLEPFPMAEINDLRCFWMGLLDIGLAAQTTALAAEAEGLQSCFNGNIINMADKVDALLDLPRYVAPAVMLTLGYPRTRRKQPHKYAPSLMVHENTYRAHPDEAVFEAYRAHNNHQKLPPNPKTVAQICQTAAALHGEDYAETIRADIARRGYVGSYQYWLGAYYPDGAAYLDGPAMAEYFARKGFGWLAK